MYELKRKERLDKEFNDNKHHGILQLHLIMPTRNEAASLFAD